MHAFAPSSARRLAALLVPAVLLAAQATSRGDGGGPGAGGTGPKVVHEAVYLAVEGLKGDAGATRVEAAVKAVEGVASFAWTARSVPTQAGEALSGEAKVVRVAGKAADAALVAAVTGAGASGRVVPTTEVTLVFQKPLHCDGCVLRVEEVCKAVAGTKEVDVAADRTKVRVVFDPKRAEVDAYKKALAAAKYPVQ